MKFLCERCKTRYSIGDERVRGKILKIRCKNCANVITVREGMMDADAAEAALGIERRPKHSTTAAPTVASEAPAAPAAAQARNGALGAAFASAMAQPPPAALEEEWYVSIDGEQAGPFSLAEAQRWVAGKSYDADLHCWREGFDDWLPVDKVSHFRGLRKRPAASAPPPLPRVAPGAAPRAPSFGAGAARAPAMPVEEEPKPLFAATMASLEKSASAPSAGPGSGLRTLGGGGAGPAPGNNGRATPMPVAARTNGSAAKPLPQPTRTSAPRVEPARGKGLPSFDVGDPNESATQIEAPSFDEHATTAEPVASARRKVDQDVFAKATAPALDSAVTAPRVPATSMPTADEDIDGDGELDIGEVSRVVNLADIARSGARSSKPRQDRAPAARRPGPIAASQSGSFRASAQRIGGGTAPAVAIGGVPTAESPMDGSELVPQLLPPAPVSHRRGMIALLVGATVLLGAAIAIVFFVTQDDSSSSSGLRTVDQVDTLRPDDPRRPGSDGSASPVEPPPNPFVPRRQIRPPIRPENPPSLPSVNSIKADEIEEMASKYSATTTRCYMRSQRGADAILIGDVKRIAVTLAITADGSVSDVQLSDNHASNTLGKCLIGSIRGWRFRTSPGGTFKFVLAFGGA